MQLRRIATELHKLGTKRFRTTFKVFCAVSRFNKVDTEKRYYSTFTDAEQYNLSENPFGKNMCSMVTLIHVLAKYCTSNAIIFFKNLNII